MTDKMIAAGMADEAVKTALHLHQTGKLLEAGEIYRKVLASDPNHVDALILLGVVAFQIGRDDFALGLLDHALSLAPHRAEAHKNRGIVLKKLGRYDEALEAFEASLTHVGGNVELRRELGGAFNGLGKHDRAEAVYRTVLDLDDGDPNALTGLGIALLGQGRVDDSVLAYERALKRSPDCVVTLGNLGNAYVSQGRSDAAEQVLRRALELEPTSSVIHNNLGGMYKERGWLTEALAAYQRAMDLEPTCDAYRNNLLMTAGYADSVDLEALGQMHLRVGSAMEAPYRANWPRHGNIADPGRRLRVGYVSADLRQHSVAFFLEPLIQGHDTGKIDLIFYSLVNNPDEVTERLRRRATLWRSAFGLSDDALANLIRADGVDILVDLSGHTSGNRLSVFARKPAPVQVSWLGYGTTTGLTAMDWRLTDPWLTPDDCREIFSEKLWRLPRCSFVFAPVKDMPPPGPLPMDANGSVTFGSFNNLSKINRRTIDLWSKLMLAVPGSRLVLKGRASSDNNTTRLFSRMFAENGVDTGRLIWRAQISDFREHLKEYDTIDIMIDSLPYNGGTTSCESLSRGVPVLSLAGDRMLSRFGLTFLAALGLDHLAPDTDDGFIAAAQALIAAPEELRQLRKTLPDRMLASPLCDGKDFARAVEDAYRGMWRSWCDGVRGDVG